MITLENLPNHWGWLPIRSIFTESDTRCGDNLYDLLSVTQAKGIIKQSDIDIKKDSSNDDKSKYKVVLKDSIAYNKMRMWQGAVGINEIDDGIVSPAYVVINPIKEMNTKFYYYLFKTPYMISQFGKYSYGLVDDMNSLRYDDFQKIYIPIPPIEEQNKIVDLIDKKSTYIEKFIQDKTQFIQLLKEQKEAVINEAVTIGIDDDIELEESGIEWFKRVPKNWKIYPFKFLVKKNGFIRGPFGSALKTSFFTKSGYKVYEQKNAIYNDINLGSSYVSKEKYQELRRFEIKEKDFLMSCSGTIGKITQVPTNFEAGIINQAMLIIRLKEKAFDDKFFNYLFGSHYMQAQVIDNSLGSAMKNLVGLDVFKNIRIPLPPYEEQLKIVEYIENELNQIDKLIDKTTKEIELIKEYKTSLINEAVSGKIKVV